MTPESQLKRDVSDDMKRAGIMFVRVNSGGYRGRMKGAPKGTPDFLGVRGGTCGHVFDGQLICRRCGNCGLDLAEAGEIDNGRAFAIETKATHKDNCKCASCEAQRGFRRDWEARGGLYILARKREDVWSGLGIQIEGRKAG